MKDDAIHPVETIPVALPEAEIYRRLGRNRHRAVCPGHQRGRLERLMREAFALCRLRGVYRVVAIDPARRPEEETTLADGTVIPGRQVAALLARARAVLLFAATAGEAVTEAIGSAGRAGDGVRALVYDATASETVDAAVGWVGEWAAAQLRRGGFSLTARRFSPGYGDLPLSFQREFARMLELETRLGVRLSPYDFMQPEKSVTALAGLE